MKKNRWTNFVDRASIKIQKAIDNLEDDDLDTNERIADFKTEMTQIALVHDFTTKE
jgi:hypothetical protein